MIVSLPMTLDVTEETENNEPLNEYENDIFSSDEGEILNDVEDDQAHDQNEEVNNQVGNHVENRRYPMRYRIPRKIEGAIPWTSIELED